MNNWFNNRFNDEEGNTVFLRGKDHMESFISSRKYAQRLEISYHFNGNHKTKLPNEAMLVHLDQLEQKLEHEFAKEGKAILVLSFTGNHRRTWQVYSTDVYASILAINRAIDTEVPLDIVHDTDEDWLFYKNFYLKDNHKSQQ
ncbi:DUF695 domain-containing protein [Elizabethkingia argentiflava]|uniref:DUF695 domain-containing protein n=1 Tax=Elizabethkingia argenteiflava TaxID=2681556 RepID=A0A845PVY3_9FLAO|nr:DUF695 domain-containing protein [Elizabethkingia argenteiflava]NAW50270.1 DUF695 domain-containing protein [Elizabethkingia argenteiflava]